MKFLEKLQAFDERRKQRIMIVVTVIVMIIIVWVWLAYFNSIVVSGATP